MPPPALLVVPRPLRLIMRLVLDLTKFSTGKLRRVKRHGEQQAGICEKCQQSVIFSVFIKQKLKISYVYLYLYLYIDDDREP